MYDYAIVSGGFDPLHLGHLKMFKEASKIGKNVIVLVNSDDWLTRKKGKPFMPGEQRVEIIQELECVHNAILQTDDSDDSSSSAIRNFAIKNADSSIVFCNGGDRSSTKKIRESEVCNRYDIDMQFGIGGNHKIASSSELIKDFQINTVERPWGRYKELAEGNGYRVKELIVDPGKSLSDQFHLHRSEHWVVLEGAGHIKQGGTRSIEEREFFIVEGESVYIRPTQTHKLTNPGEIPLRLVEIWAGQILSEDDIVRLDVDDNYGVK